MIISMIITLLLMIAHQSHGYPNSREERSWFQMSIPFLDATVQFQPPTGLDPDRLFSDLMTPLQQWNPLEPSSFMRPFFDGPNRFRPMLPPPPPPSPAIPPPLPPFGPPSSEPSIPSTQSPNSISDPEPESSFSVSSTFNPSRRRYKPRWYPHHSHRPGSKRHGSGVRGTGYGNRGFGNRGSGSDNNSNNDSGNNNNNGCRYGTKGGRKCRPGHRFWEKSKPSPSHPPSWPFFVFPPPRPSYDDEPKLDVPKVFTEVTKNIDPACGNRHLPRPTKPAVTESTPSTSSSTTTPASTTSSTAAPEIPNTDNIEWAKNNVNSTKEITPASTTSTTTTTEVSASSESSADIEPSSISEASSSPSSVQPSVSISSTPLTSPSSSPSSIENAEGTDVQPEIGWNPSDSDIPFVSRDRSNGSETEPGKEDEKKVENSESSVSYESNEDSAAGDGEKESKVKKNINNVGDVSPSGLMTTMGPLDTAGVKEKETKEENEKRVESNADDDGADIKRKENESVDLLYSPPSVSDQTPDSSSSPSSTTTTTTTTTAQPSSPSEIEVTSTESSEPAAAGVTNLGSSSIDSSNEADTVPDENDQGNAKDEAKSASVDVDVETKKKRDTEREQFIKQIESMSVEEFRKLASKISSLSR